MTACLGLSTQTTLAAQPVQILRSGSKELQDATWPDLPIRVVGGLEDQLFEWARSGGGITIWRPDEVEEIDVNPVGCQTSKHPCL